MRELLISVAWAVVGAGLLRLFYLAVRTEWPTSYVALETDRGVLVNRSVFRYLLFMCGPLCLVVLLTSVIAGRSGGNSNLSAALVTIAHLAFVIGGHIWLSSRRRASTPIVAMLILDGTICLLTVGTTVLGVVLGSRFSYVVPSTQDFFSSLWTTAFVAIVAVCVVALSRKTYSDQEALERSRRELGDMETNVRNLCQQSDVNADIIIAILHAENLQRPSWVRRAERLKGKLSPHGSYGIMQITSDRPLSDLESIQVAISRESARESHNQLDGSSYSNAVEAFQAHNDNPRFIELARALWFRLSYETSLRSSQEQRDRPNPHAPGNADRRDVAIRIFRAMGERLAVDRLENLLLLSDVTALQRLADALEQLPVPASKVEGELARIVNAYNDAGESTDEDVSEP